MAVSVSQKASPAGAISGAFEEHGRENGGSAVVPFRNEEREKTEKEEMRDGGKTCTSRTHLAQR